jgi:hypothetical protein
MDFEWLENQVKEEACYVANYEKMRNLSTLEQASSQSEREKNLRNMNAYFNILNRSRHNIGITIMILYGIGFISLFFPSVNIFFRVCQELFGNL